MTASSYWNLTRTQMCNVKTSYIIFTNHYCRICTCIHDAYYLAWNVLSLSFWRKSYIVCIDGTYCSDIKVALFHPFLHLLRLRQTVAFLSTKSCAVKLVLFGDNYSLIELITSYDPPVKFVRLPLVYLHWCGWRLRWTAFHCCQYFHLVDTSLVTRPCK
jgi:hypothetical protein